MDIAGRFECEWDCCDSGVVCPSGTYCITLLLVFTGTVLLYPTFALKLMSFSAVMIDLIRK